MGGQRGARQESEMSSSGPGDGLWASLQEVLEPPAEKAAAQCDDGVGAWHRGQQRAPLFEAHTLAGCHAGLGAATDVASCCAADARNGWADLVGAVGFETSGHRMRSAPRRAATSMAPKSQSLNGAPASEPISAAIFAAKSSLKPPS